MARTGELARTIHHQLFNVLLGFIVVVLLLDLIITAAIAKARASFRLGKDKFEQKLRSFLRRTGYLT